MMNSIKIDSVFLDFRGVDILRGASLDFKPNKITGLLGRNGSGKSCFLKIIIGQLAPQSMHIKYDDKKLLNLYKEKGLVNYLPQHEFHPKSIKIRELLSIYQINKALFFHHYPFLKERYTERFSNLSGGQRRTIEVLLVLEANSKFSILDEPFSHIMPIHVDLVKNRIVELSSKKGILVTDHQYRNVIDISDDLYLMKNGALKPIKGVEDLQTQGYIR